MIGRKNTTISDLTKTGLYVLESLSLKERIDLTRASRRLEDEIESVTEKLSK